MIDHIDRKLIALLQNDGRLAFSTLGQEVGLSDAATRQRIRRLRSLGVMDVVAVTDPRKLGYDQQAMIGVKVTGDAQKVATDIANMAESYYVVMTTGRHDIQVEVVCADIEALTEVGDQLRAIDGVAWIEISTYLSVVKDNYNWGAQ